MIVLSCCSRRAAKQRCLTRVDACTKCGVDELARDIQALTHDVAALRADLELYRNEIRDVFDRILDEHRPVSASTTTFPRRRRD